MPSSILSVAYEALDSAEINLSRPDSLFAASNEGDTTDRKVVRALNKTARALAAAHDWQVIRRERVFSTVAAEVQTNAIPRDFLRFVPQTMMDRSRRLEIIGPVPPDQWQWIKSYYQATASLQYVQRGDDILFFPVPTAGMTIAYEYITNAIGKAPAVSFTGSTASTTTVTVADTDGLAVGQIVSGTGITAYTTIEAITADTSITLSHAATATASGVSLTATTYRSAFAANTDMALWDDELMVLGLIYALKSGEGYDAAREYRDYKVCLGDRLKQDGGKRIFSMAGTDPRSVDARLAAMKNQAIVIVNS